MAQQEQTTFIVKAIEQGFDKVLLKLNKVDQAQKKVSSSSDKAGKSVDKYGRRTRAAAQMTSNSTKEFSKMQQNIEGGGSGGLVRAYALLAANVFALSAAFGILSRSAQIDTLVESMTQLEIVSGKSIRGVARDLQEASGFGMDFANSLRATSLALSAGFESKQIMELGEVARNAAVSLGRNLPDALDRIFRGVIKVEPELLDEIGLFVRVNEAASKYASKLGVSVGSLTEFQRRQAFANEAIAQGQQKFQAFADVPIDPFAKLATTFSDITQNILTFLNKGIGPLVNIISDNKILFGQAFAIIGITLLRLVVPAIGQFTLGIAMNAQQAKKSAAESAEQSQAKIAQLREEQVEFAKLRKAKLDDERVAATTASQKGPQAQLKVGGRAVSKQLEQDLKNQVGLKERQVLIEKRLGDLETKRGLKQRKKNTDAAAELKLLQAELEIIKKIRAEEQIINFEGPMPGAKKNELADMTRLAAEKSIIKADAVAGIVATSELEGLSAGFNAIGPAIDLAGMKAEQAGIKFGFLDKATIFLQGSLGTAAVKIQKVMMTIMPFISAMMFAIPILTFIAKKVGFFGEAQGNLSQANKETEETLGMFTKKLDHANEQLKKFRGDKNFKGITDSTLALKEATLSTIESLEKQIEAFEDYKKETNILVRAINSTVSDFFGDTALQKIEQNIDDFIEQLRKGGGELTEEMDRLVRKLGRREFFFGIGAEEVREAILTRARLEAENFKSIKSAIDGARDSAREFSDSLITKTQVDKPLGSFKQINENIRIATLRDQERTDLLNEIVADNAVLALLTEDQRNALTDINNTEEERLQVLKDVQLEFERQQELLIQQKGLLGEIKGLRSQVKGLLKFSVTAIELENKLLNQRRAIELELLQKEVNRKIAATGITEERLKELSTVGSLVGREKELKIETENIAQVHSAILAIRQLQTEESKEEMRLATQQLKIDNDKIKAALVFMNVEKKLNASLKARVATQNRLAQAQAGGGIEDTFATRVATAIEEEEIRNKNLQERIDAEIAVAQFQFKLAKLELDVIKQRNKVVINEMNARQLELMNKQFSGTMSASEKAELKQLIAERNKIREGNIDISMTQNALDQAAEDTANTIISTYASETEKFGEKLVQTFESTFAGSGIGEGLQNIFDLSALGDGKTDAFAELLQLKDKNGDPLFTEEQLQMKIFETQLIKFGETMEALFGSEGKLVGALASFSASLLGMSTALAVAFDPNDPLFTNNPLTNIVNEETAGKVAAVAEAISGALAGLSSVFSAYMQNNIKEVDNLIDAEKKRDGKSAESLAKLQALEKKKDAMKRKEFETNKKIMMAQAIASTAAGVAGALASSAVLGPFAAAALATMIGVMGAAQVAIISKLQYNGGVQDIQPTKASLQIGKQSNAVNVAQGATAGELNYLRGGNTTGQNLGGAGGAMGRRGYADGGIVVGERGPEVITPSAPVDITPNFALGGGTQNINFSINAIDAAGVEDVLMNQQGNIIRMIREAANENGERFLETVDTQTYGSNT